MMRRFLLTTFLVGAYLAPLCEATVITGGVVVNGPVNIAIGGTATQSPDSSGGVASRAIDGNRSGIFTTDASTTHTTDAAGSFWEVDLGSAQSIDYLQLFNRQDCCRNRLSNFQLSIHDTSGGLASWSQSYHTSGSSVELGQGFDLPAGTMGQVVRVELLGPGAGGEQILSLAEVEILQGMKNVALFGTASQSSTLVNGANPVASKANDGVINGLFNYGSTTHTLSNGASNNFWEVSLDQSYDIHEIALHNRGDACCGIRLSNFRVSIFAGASEVWGENYFEGTGSVAAAGIFSISDDALAAVATGDRVRVQLLGLNNQGNSVLSLTEVEVFGVAAIPEPSTFALFGIGLLALGARRFRRAAK